MSVAERPQHMVALDEANRVRLARAALRRRVVAGELTARQALDDEDAQGAALFDVLQWQPRWGRSRARKLLRRVGGDLGWPIGELKRVRDLTGRQRAAVLALLAADDDS